jgi:hypothetical protein
MAIVPVRSEFAGQKNCTWMNQGYVWREPRLWRRNSQVGRTSAARLHWRERVTRRQCGAPVDRRGSDFSGAIRHREQTRWVCVEDLRQRSLVRTPHGHHRRSALQHLAPGLFLEPHSVSHVEIYRHVENVALASNLIIIRTDCHASAEPATYREYPAQNLRGAYGEW